MAVGIPSMDLVSILLPFTNEGLWLKEAVSSIIKQSYTCWELILIGNRSDAYTMEIVESYRQDPRIRILKEERPGISHALNNGLRAANGNFIARMDADDVCLPDRLWKQMDCLLKSPHVDAVSCQTAFHPDGIPGEGFSEYMDWQNSMTEPTDHHRNRFIESPLAHPTILFRKELIDELGVYQTGELPEDYELWLRWMHAGKLICKLPIPLYLWRDHQGRLSRVSPSYSRDSFNQLRFSYLALDLIKRNIRRPVILCGGRRLRKKAAQILEKEGVKIAGYADLKKTDPGDKLFIHAGDIGKTGEFYFISITGGRGKSREMRSFFNNKGLREYEDYIIAA